MSLAGEVREADQRARILAEIDAVLPWDDLCALIARVRHQTAVLGVFRPPTLLESTT